MNMYKKANGQRGFTLIELLVVIAIIGLLSAVVLAAVNGARVRGIDASIRSNMGNLHLASEIFFETNNQYTAVAGNTCATGFLAQSPNPAAVTAIEGANGAGSMVCSLTAGSNGAWAVSTPLIGTNPAFWCVDSTGYKGAIGAMLLAGDTTCI